jgi:hypothetical protein
MAFTPDERRVREAETTLIRQVQVLQASAVRGEVLDHSSLLRGSRIPGREARPNFPQLRTALTTVILAKNLVCGVSLSHGGKREARRGGGWVVRNARVAAEGKHPKHSKRTRERLRSSSRE